MNKNREICCALVCAALLAVPELRGQDIVSLNLKQAVDMALRNSRDVALAQARYNVAQNTVEVNRSAFRPNLFTGIKELQSRSAAGLPLNAIHL